MPARSLPHDHLRQIARAALAAVGTSPENAALVADSLVDANLAGHDSHGVIRLPQYIQAAQDGHVAAAASPTVTRTEAATATIDAATGWGQPGMWLATETVTELASRFGVAAAVVNRSYHIGRCAPYVERIARAGMVGIALANAAPAVAPYGGSSRVMGTNPIAWAVPRGGGLPPVCLDVATAGIAEGKLRVARGKGELVPPGYLVDTDGRSTQDPNDFYAGGTLLPFGLHKGSGFSLLAQFLGRGLAGMDPTPYGGPRGTNGPVILAINIAPFVALGLFTDQIDAQCAAVLASPPADGFTDVLLPGDPEHRVRAARESSGIPIPDRTWTELQAMATTLGISLD